MNAYFTDSRVATRHIPKINLTHGFIEFICSIVAFFTCDAVVKIIKIGVSVLCFIGFFGVIGGIESYTISAVTGLLICGMLSIIEFAVLKSIMNKNTGKERQ